jgi:hypothetical protein
VASSPALAAIARLDPIADHERIVRLSCRQDFPFDTTRALELALFRTFAVPSIGGLLAATGEFEARPQRRYDDTDLLVSELMEHGYSSERGRRALARINALHARFAIDNDDMRYVLTTFVFVPLEWNARYGWRRFTEVEQDAWFRFWQGVGAGMGIRDVPALRAEFESFMAAYERARYRPNAASTRVALATRELFVGWAPRFLRPLARRCILALLDPPLRTAFGFAPPPRLLAWLVPALLRARAVLLRWLPRRRQPLLRTARATRSHPAGYAIEELGPPRASGPVADRGIQDRV